jgi:hypothetical protein
MFSAMEHIYPIDRQPHEFYMPVCGIRKNRMQGELLCDIRFVIPASQSMLMLLQLGEGSMTNEQWGTENFLMHIFAFQSLLFIPWSLSHFHINSDTIYLAVYYHHFQSNERETNSSNKKKEKLSS